MKAYIRKYYYGDYGESKQGPADVSTGARNKHEWPLWEIFIRSKQGLDHKHVGSLHAADAAMAIENARDQAISGFISPITYQQSRRLNKIPGSYPKFRGTGAMI